MPRLSAGADAPIERRNVAGVLRLLGSGATGPILLALADGPLRTNELTALAPGFAPRTVYRYLGKLVEIGAIEREEEPGVPSKVVYRLDDPCGVDLYEVVEAYARALLEPLPGGGIVPHSWWSLALLADLWESGMLEELYAGPRTAAELARLGHGLSSHQVARRISLLLTRGLIREARDPRSRRRYELTEKARQGTALIDGLERWHERRVLSTQKD